ncbi:hypothetical protein MOV08_05335 [Streptomyces yunnanensis]|uniref:Uncharacterized protein n=1 Tax=Streptomyces yunnanensis TaxID=156453 RepID=A0ABY8A1G2_9ACTN|nr:hypothetical protein [Streptomyces yunnanensis]WEB38784.1 hypothetical protein MOV08_05335 [Streptomyces yunnanensis]
MPDVSVRTPHQAAEEVRGRLDAGLRRAEVSAESRVSSGVVEGVKVSRVRLTALTLEETQRLTLSIGGRVTRSREPLARVAAKELDAALLGISIRTSPSLVIVGTVKGRTANKVLPPSLSITNARRLANALDAGEEE